MNNNALYMALKDYVDLIKKLFMIAISLGFVGFIVVLLLHYFNVIGFFVALFIGFSATFILGSYAHHNRSEEEKERDNYPLHK